MVMKANSVLELLNDSLIPQHKAEIHKLDRIDRWHRWTPEPVDIPQKASIEHKKLLELAETPWLNLVVTTIAQQLVAELVRSTKKEDTSEIWEPWLRNRMPSRQRALHRSALTYGYAYTTVTPGDNGAYIRGYSPRDMYAVYGDPIVDEYPMYYMRRSGSLIYLVDEEYVYTVGDEGGKLKFIEINGHGVGVAPAVRYSNQIDLEGRTPGEVEPFISVAKRVNKTTYDRLLAQHFNSWKVRTATGLQQPSEEERDALKLMLRQNDILTGEEGVQFGTLDETPLDGFLKAEAAEVETLAAVSQTPAHAMSGQMNNMAADAIAEARSILDLKGNERKIGLGDSHVQTLRLSSHVEGREDDAKDYTLSMQWADLGTRSMSQAADALGKMVTQMSIPPELLWDRIPGVTGIESRAWLEYKKRNPSADEQLVAALNRQSNGTDG